MAISDETATKHLVQETMCSLSLSAVLRVVCFAFISPLRIEQGPVQLKRVNSDEFLRGRTVTWGRSLVGNFLRVPLACMGSREVAEQLWNSQKAIYKTSYQSNGTSKYSAFFRDRRDLFYYFKGERDKRSW